MGRGVGIGCALAAFSLDQGTKALALGTPALAHGVEVIPVLNLVLVRNHGVSFGMLGGVVPWWGLILLSLAIVAALVVWLWRSETRQASVALGLVIGGALGNVIDRARFQAVTDFLDFHLAGYHWPAFNLADVAVVCGVALLMFDGFRAGRKKA
ncbi:signal peptidase II [Pseudorhizobium flavum]|uniref:Lipoprotein signal peptidase n=1 Tax=Pseudorhizobium flavum TaxID=1335061 RepID=A0A7X0DGS2_9HYPH|nr:signal peptidase II [Pseudorhizobium flavum]MBB6182464.1 signal peptidase II [Pseudorhizobium flavum]CAD6630673.1 signal peptidase II [Pseudorhizobium flavum]